MVMAGLLTLVANAPAFAADGNGGRDGVSTPAGSKAAAGSLIYDSFTGFNCSQSGFVTSAVAHLDISGPVTGAGTTTLDGVPYDAYVVDNLGSGPDTFPTSFFRTFTPPPPSSSTYVFVYTTIVTQNGAPLGQSITTIECADGAFSASNVWLGVPEPIPAGHPAAWAALALLLAGGGLARLARRRA
ncbi:hypothetical protein BURK1_01060 [Burkholderiales bacterium]|nr:hypothetical protein BURK1_01060 [Burkholderiales bacterium]